MVAHRPYSLQEPMGIEDRRSPATLSSNDAPPLHEPLGGYIFVCNNDTMGEDLKRNLFGLPQRYHDSVRAIQPGMPLFLYNYTMHQLHGIFEASSEGGLNLDPIAWENKDFKNGRPASRFPSQVRVRLREERPPLSEQAFRPVLHHYDGPKFRLELSQEQVQRLLVLFGGSPEKENQTSSQLEASVQVEDDGGEWEKVKGRSKSTRNHATGSHRGGVWGRRASSPGKWRHGGSQPNGYSSSTGHGNNNSFTDHDSRGRDVEDRQRADGADAPRWRVDPDGSGPSQGSSNTTRGGGEDHHRDSYRDHHDGWGGGRRGFRNHRDGGSSNGGTGNKTHHHGPTMAKGGHVGGTSGYSTVRDSKDTSSLTAHNSNSGHSCLLDTKNDAISKTDVKTDVKFDVKTDVKSDVKADDVKTSASSSPGSSVIDMRVKPVSFAAALRGATGELGFEQSQSTGEDSLSTPLSTPPTAGYVPGNGGLQSGGKSKAYDGFSGNGNVNNVTSNSQTAPVTPKPRVLPSGRGHSVGGNNRKIVRERANGDAERVPSTGGKGAQHQESVQTNGKADKKMGKPMENGISGEAHRVSTSTAEKPFAWGRRMEVVQQGKEASRLEGSVKVVTPSSVPSTSSNSSTSVSNAATARIRKSQGVTPVELVKGGEGSPVSGLVQVRPQASNSAELLSTTKPVEGSTSTISKPIVRRQAWQGNDGAILRHLATHDTDSNSNLSNKAWQTEKTPSLDTGIQAGIQSQQTRLQLAGQRNVPAVSQSSQPETAQVHRPPPSLQSKAHFPCPPNGVTQAIAGEMEEQGVEMKIASSPSPADLRRLAQWGTEGEVPRSQSSVKEISSRQPTTSTSNSHATLPRVHTRPAPRQHSSDHYHEKIPQRKLTPPLRQDIQTPPLILQPPPQLHPLPPSAAAAPPFRISTPPLGLTSPTIHHFSPVYSHSQPASPHNRASRVRQGFNSGDPVSPIYRTLTPRIPSDVIPPTQNQPAALFSPLSGLQPLLSPIVGHPHFPMPASALLSNVTVLHNEVMDYSELVRPPKEARARAESAVDCVRGMVKSLWPGADVEVFGSFATGLALPNSDVDLAIINAPPPPDTPETQALSGARINAPLIRDLAALLQKQEWCESMYTIETARIPVIKLKCQPQLRSSVSQEEAAASPLSFQHSEGEVGGGVGGDGNAHKNVDGESVSNIGTREIPGANSGGDQVSGISSYKNVSLPPVAMDITIAGCRPSALDGSEGTSKEWTMKLSDAVNAHNGEAAREFVKERMQRLPALAPLVLLLKSWLQHRGLNDVYTGGLGSFSLTLMLVFYLERAPVPVGVPTCAPPSYLSVSSENSGSHPSSVTTIHETEVGISSNVRMEEGEGISSNVRKEEVEGISSNVREEEGTLKEEVSSSHQAPSLTKTEGEDATIEGRKEGGGVREDGESLILDSVVGNSTEAAYEGPSYVSESTFESEKTNEMGHADFLPNSILKTGSKLPSEENIEESSEERLGREEGERVAMGANPSEGEVCSISKENTSNALSESKEDERGEGEGGEVVSFVASEEESSLATSGDAKQLEEAGGGVAGEGEGETSQFRGADVSESCQGREEHVALLEAYGENISDEIQSRGRNRENTSEGALPSEEIQEKLDLQEGLETGRELEIEKGLELQECSSPSSAIEDRLSSEGEKGKEVFAPENSPLVSSSPKRAVLGKSRFGIEGKSIVEELPDSIKSVPSPSFGILLVGFLQAFGHEIDFSRVRLVLKSDNGLQDGVFWHDPSQRPTALWIDDPLRPGANIGAGSFAIWHVQAAFRDLLISVTRPQQFPIPPQGEEDFGRRRSLYLLEQAFNAKFLPPGISGRI